MAFTDFGGVALGPSRQALLMRVRRDVKSLVGDDRRFRDIAGIAYALPQPEVILPNQLSDDDTEGIPAALLAAGDEPAYMDGLTEQEKSQVRVVGSDETRAQYASDLRAWRKTHG